MIRPIAIVTADALQAWIGHGASQTPAQTPVSGPMKGARNPRTASDKIAKKTPDKAPGKPPAPGGEEISPPLASASLRFLRATQDDTVFHAYNGEAWVDGYGFGDRLLEDVAFGFSIGANGALTARVSPRAEAYLRKLNAKHWIRIARAYALQQDVFASNEAMADDDLVLYRVGVPHHKQAFSCPSRIHVIEQDGSVSVFEA